MVILGIDPGFAIVGFGVLQNEKGKQKLLSCGAIRTEAGLPLPTRLLQIENDMAQLFEAFHPDAMAVEELFFTNNMPAASPPDFSLRRRPGPDRGGMR